MAAERALQTPTPYELVVVHKTDSARAHAERLAAQGADEGTLVWAKSQYEGLGRNHRHWMSGYRNLHLALIVKPEQGFDTVCQLSLVATICTALAIAEQAEPMEELRYRWPNDVLLNRGKVAGLTLSGRLKADETPHWVVLGLNVNVFDHPTSLGLDASSMRGEGFECYDRARLAEQFCRQFLSWVNRWANDGFAPVRRAWLTRGRGEPLAQTVRLENGEITGTFSDLDASGALVLEVAGQGLKKISLSSFFAPDFTRDQ